MRKMLTKIRISEKLEIKKEINRIDTLIDIISIEQNKFPRIADNSFRHLMIN